MNPSKKTYNGRTYERDPVVTKRRAKVARLMDKGLKGTEIAGRLNLVLGVVCSDVMIIRKHRKEVKPKVPKAPVFWGLPA